MRKPSLVFSSHLNTHIVYDDAALAKRLRQLRIGDEVTLQRQVGQLQPRWFAHAQILTGAQ